MVSVEKLGPPQKLDVLASVFLVGFAERHGAGILSVAEVLAKAGGAPPPGRGCTRHFLPLPKGKRTQRAQPVRSHWPAHLQRCQILSLRE